jgi:hypothetical protein
MGRGEKLLERMRGNPRDWRIEDVEALCSAFELDFDEPRRGSHYSVRNPGTARKLTIPFARPIRPVYIRQLVRLVDAAKASGKD